MKIISLILARGGSKTIHKKNIIDLNGNPLIYYSIKESIDSDVDETWVGTDDNEIKNISLKYGAKVIDRPNKITTDISTSEESLLYFAENVNFDVLVFIQPTSPMIKYIDINNGIKKILSNEYDSVVALTVVNDILLWDINKIKPINYKLKNRGMKQTRDYFGIETGSLYITKRKNLIESKCRISGNIGYIEIPFWRSFQVDYMDDLKNIGKLMI